MVGERASLNNNKRRLTARTDLKRQTFGYLRVLRENKARRYYWDCLCEKKLGGCGKRTTVYGGSLTSGRSQGCGCRRKSGPLTTGKMLAAYAASREQVDEHGRKWVSPGGAAKRLGLSMDGFSYL